MMLLSWGECYQAAGRLWQRQRERRWEHVYGVPRGGCVAALIVQSLAHRDGLSLMLLDRPDLTENTLIVDDIIDSGKTLRPFHEQGFTVDGLYRSKIAPSDLAPLAIELDGWCTFPYETAEGTGAEDVGTRLLQFIGEDPSRDGLKETPKRYLKAWRDMTIGYHQNPQEILSKCFDQPHDELVVLRGIEFHSTCEHHLLPFYGTAAVGYIPGKQVVGISKLARLVECFARRLQIQERLTQEIADAITSHLNPMGVGVVIKAKHSCMGARGVGKPDADMITSVTTGLLRTSPSARAEFLSLIQL